MRLIKLNEENVIIQVRYNAKEIIEDEIESDIGKLGQKMNEDGTFSDLPIVPIEPQPTIEEQILSENQYQTALLEMQLLGGM